MSMRYSGAARRSFIIGSSEWPPASRRASVAAEIGALAGRATTTLDEHEPVERMLHIAVTGCVEEHIAGPLLAAFSERTPEVHAVVEVEPAARFAELLHHRRADIALGPR